MRSLRECQAAFGRALVDGPEGALLAGFAGPPERAAGRFAAYRRNVLGNWRAALAGGYPVVAAQLGPVRFDALAAAYASAHGSADADLNAYGGALPEFLQDVDAGREFPWLPDLARLERALQTAYAAADPAPPDLAPLAGLPPERQGGVRLGLWPGASLVESAWPVGAIWRAHRRDTAARDAALAALDRLPGGAAALATRDARGTPEVVDLEPAEAALWRACAAGRPLAAALAAAQAAGPGAELAATLPRWLARGLIVSIA